MESRKLTARIIFVAVVLIVLFSVGWTKNQQAKQAKQTTWEYKHIALSSSRELEYEKILNQQGSEGWELTAVEREQPGGLIHCYLKRAK